MQFDTIIYEKESNIVFIWLNRPDALNAVSTQMNIELKTALTEANNDGDIRAVVVTGQGKAFSAGIDMKEKQENKDLTVDEKSFFPKMAGGLDLIIRNYKKPIIAAVNGLAVGMGCDLALVCDLRIASDSAYFAESYVKRSFVPSAANYYLPRMVGLAKTFEILYFGENITSEEAYSMGLVNKVVSDDELIQEARDWAIRLTKLPPIPLRFIRESVYLGLETNLNNMLEYVTNARTIVRQTKDSKEAIDAFKGKREPKYEGQ